MVGRGRGREGRVSGRGGEGRGRGSGRGGGGVGRGGNRGRGREGIPAHNLRIVSRQQQPKAHREARC